MAKVAVELKAALKRRSACGAPGGITSRVLAQGDGWRVSDLICTSGPEDESFEERHAWVGLAMVVAGTFQYHSAAGRDLMLPGSVLLGNPGQCFECGHEHGTGDRCLAFHYEPDYFARLAADAGVRGSPMFHVLRLPPLRALTPSIAEACDGLVRAASFSWEELAVRFAGEAVQLARSLPSSPSAAPFRGEARVTQTLRTIEARLDEDLALSTLAEEAGLSPYHFLRTFERLTGVTPHQYILRARLREAATRLTSEPARILDVALDCGFGDVSNFNRAFRAEFGVSPRRYRSQRT